MRDTLKQYTRLPALAVYTALATATAFAAYLSIFTQFAVWDDEGSGLVTLKALVQGDVLYRDIYVPYGPFYYEVFGGLFALTGWAVSNNASRLIVIVVWVLASCLYGISVQRLSGRLVLGATAMIVAFSVLSVLVNEPMHPHGLVVVLFACLTLLFAGGPPHRRGAAGALAGALLSAMLLTKVNLGGLALAAVGFAAVLTLEPLYRRRWLRWCVTAAFVVLPTLLLSRELRAPWVRDLIALELLATIALLVAASSLRPAQGEADHASLRWLLGAVLGSAAAFVAMIGGLLLTGATLFDLYDGAIAQALKIGDVFINPFTSSPIVLDLGVAAVAAAVLAVRMRPREPDSPSIWPGLLRAAAGLGIWLTITRASPFLVDIAGNPISLPLVLAWVAAIPPAGIEKVSYLRFARVALPALAVAESLQVYPVPGSQVGIASVSFVVVGGICLGDGLRLLRTWSAARGQHALERFNTVAAVLLAALAARLVLSEIVLAAATNAVAYRDQPALPLPGADLIHLPASQAREYAALAHLLKIHQCTSLIGYPNLNSLYLWSAIDPPKPSAPGAWPAVLDSERQQRIVDQMRAASRPCAVRDDLAASFWLQNRPPPDTPLVRYIFNDFQQVAAVGGWQFLVAKRPN